MTSHGNYQSYYAYRLSSNERSSSFCASWFKGLSCIDIGCNAGEFTLSVAKKFQPKHILGIDIDAKLIQKAQTRLADICTQNRPTFLIPRSLALKADNFVRFPKNVAFQEVDITTQLDDQSSKYDTILCMSVAKVTRNLKKLNCLVDRPFNHSFIHLALNIQWIHLNKGDEGLLSFFRKLFKLSKPGGHVILEYQPWKSYVNNKNASEITKKNFREISIRPDDFERVLIDTGFSVIDRLGSSLCQAKGFERPILVLGKRAERPFVPEEATVVYDVCTKKLSRKRSRSDEEEDNMADGGSPEVDAGRQEGKEKNKQEKKKKKTRKASKVKKERKQEEEG